MDLLSGYSDNALAGFNGYTPQANAGIANNNSEYLRNQMAIALMGQQQIDRNTAAIAATGPSSGYGTVGGYPTFGDPAPEGTYSPGSGRSSFSGTPLQQPQEQPYNGYPSYEAAVKAYNEAMGGGQFDPGLTRVNVGQSPYVYSDPYSHMGIFPGYEAPTDWNQHFNEITNQPTQPAPTAPASNFNTRFDNPDITTPEDGRLNYRPSDFPGMNTTPQGGGGLTMLPGGGIDQNDPGNIAAYYRLMGMGNSMAAMPGGGGGVPTPEGRPYIPFDTYPQTASGPMAETGRGLGNETQVNTYGAPGSGQVGRFDAFGGYSPYQGYGATDLGNQGYDRMAGYGDSGTVLPWSGSGLKYTPGGGLDTSDPGNIAFYNRMMNGGQQGVTDPMGYGNPYDPQIGNSNIGQQNFNDLYGWRAGGQGMPQMMQPEDYSKAQQQQATDQLKQLQKQLEYFLYDPNGRQDPHTVPQGFPETIQPRDIDPTLGGSKGA